MPPNASPPAAPDDLMTSVDAARILGLSVDMVRRLAKEGRLPFLSTIRGVRLFRRANVEQLADQRSVARGPRASTRTGEPKAGPPAATKPSKMATRSVR